MVLDERKVEIMEKIKSRFDQAKCSQVERMLSIMANPIRFHILCALVRDSFSVSELVELTGGKLSNISQQLKIMTLAGYIGKERVGKQSIYSIRDERITAMVHQLENLFGS